MLVNEYRLGYYRFNSRKFGRCKILITFQWSGPDHWNVDLQNACVEQTLHGL
jgi:hypothetical protein